MGELNGARKGTFVNLDALVPDKIHFHVHEQDLTVPGDLPARTAFELTKLTETFTKAQESEDISALMAAAEALHDYLLALFRIQQPKLDHLPFDFATINRIAAVILFRAMGASEETLTGLGDPPTNRATRRKTSRAKSTSPSTPLGGSPD